MSMTDGLRKLRSDVEYFKLRKTVNHRRATAPAIFPTYPFCYNLQYSIIVLMIVIEDVISLHKMHQTQSFTGFTAQ